MIGKRQHLARDVEALHHRRGATELESEAHVVRAAHFACSADICARLPQRATAAALGAHDEIAAERDSIEAGLIQHF
ncbi:hypothetical protein D3C83_29880 [compost metagenome]